jgi:uncharacterized protein (TIGR00251 family)
VPAWRIEPGGLRLAVRLTPKAAADSIDGIVTLADGTEVIRMRVRAAPESGKANAALIATLARALGIAKSRIAVVAGETSRRKDIRIGTDDPAPAAAILSALPRLD